MRDLKVGPNPDDTVLVAKYKGILYSIGNYCTHYGAPLHTGTLFGDKVYCPWHQASFNLLSGAPEGAPGLDGVPNYPVLEKAGKFYVSVPQTLQKNRTMPLA